PLEMALVEALQAAPLGASTPVPASAAAPAPSRPAAAPTAPAVRAVKPVTSGTSLAGMDAAQWGRVKDLVKQQSPNLAGLLNSSKARELREDKLLLGFATDVLRDKMQKQENLEVLEGVLEQVLGRRCTVECFLSGVNASDLPAGVDSSGAVAAAVRLGGEIVDQSDQATND